MANEFACTVFVVSL